MKNKVMKMPEKVAPAASPTPSVDQAMLDKVGEETARMGRSDRVFHWDKRQSGPEALVCGNDKAHGRLIMHGSGSLLMCMAMKNGANCTYTQPVSV